MTGQPLDDATFTSAVAAAVRAPSLHNSQPWRFRRNGDAVEVWADPARQLPAADPGGWAVRIACGAAALNLRLALAVQGHPARAVLLPDRDQPGLLVRLVPAPDRPVTPEESALARAIESRQSNRFPFADAPVSLPQQAALTSAAQAGSTDLVIVAGVQATADVADLARAADRALRSRPGYTAELLAWTRPDPASGDGVPVAAGGPAPAPHELLARRDFGGPPAADHRRYEDQPLVAVLCTFGDTPRDQLIAGVALQRVLLTATRVGLAVSLLSQPIEVPGIRAQLQDTLGRISIPQMVLRLGFAAPGPRTSRRPAESVIDDLAAH